MRQFVSLLAIGLFLIWSVDVWAQNGKASSGMWSGNGGFGGLMNEISEVLGTTGLMQGGGGAFLRNNFFIGGYGLGLSTHHYKNVSYLHPDDNTGDAFHYAGVPVKYGYGGLWLGKVFPLKNDFNISVSGMFGWGSVGWEPQVADRRRRKLYTIEENVFVMQPRVVAIYQALRWMRLEAGISYRQVITSNKQYLDTSGQGAPIWRDFFESGELSAPSFSFGLMFGSF